MNTWSYQNPVKIIFGCGCRKYLIDIVKDSKVLIICSKRGRKFIENDPLLSPITKDSVWIDSITPKPSLDFIQKEIDSNSYKKIDIIIAFGGGSSMDSAKAIAAGISINNARDMKLYDLIKNTNHFSNKTILPIIAIPTTSGTGSEVTPFATLWDIQNKKKLSLHHHKLFPKTAVVDPELTYDLPYEVTVSSGLDALNQALESIWNKNKSSLSNLIAAKSLKKVLRALPRLKVNLKDYEARKLISEASLLSGISISQTKTAICHSISYPLTAKYGIEHGIACAFTMLAVSKKVNLYEKNCFLNILNEIGLTSSDSLILKIKDIVSIFKIKEHVLDKLSNKDELYELIDEITSYGRSDNFILPVDHNLIRDIIEDSFR